MPKCHLDQIQGILGNTNPIQKSALTHLFGLSSAFQSGKSCPSSTNDYREDACSG